MGLETLSDLEVGGPDLQTTIPSDGGEVRSEGLLLGGVLQNGRISHT